MRKTVSVTGRAQSGGRALQGVLTLQMHGTFDNGFPMEQATPLDLAVRHLHVVITTTERQNIDLVPVDVEAGQRINKSDHNWIRG